MNLKKIFSALKKSSNAYAVPNEFRLTDILGEDDLLANRKLTAASYSCLLYTSDAADDV